MEVPLAALSVGRPGQRHHPRGPRVEVLHEALDRAALTGRVTILEQDHVLGAGFLCPVLKLQQLDLERVLLPFVLIAFHPLLVRIVGTPRFDRIATRVNEIRIRAVLVVTHRVPVAQNLLKIFAKVLDNHAAAPR
jgi:hypothetical protein